MEQQRPQGTREGDNSSAHPQIWWVRLCGWLWKLCVFVGTTICISLIVDVFATWFTAPSGQLPLNSPFGWVQVHWLVVLSFACSLLLLALLTGVLSRWPSRASKHDRQRLDSDQQDRQFFLQTLVTLYQHMQQESLQQKLLIELPLAEQRGAVQNAATFFFRPESELARRLPAGTTIRQIYDLSAQQLLILGAPGAGKSTLLLELAEQLTAEAQQNAALLIPLRLPLATWPQKRLPLQEWMIEQFAHLYMVPLRLCQLWVRNRQILPLLDGLDEMTGEAYTACITAINTYHQTHLGPLVVCSRTDEYTRTRQAERLKLSNAVEVLPLAPEHVDEVLTNAGKPLEALLVEYKRNHALRELATSPLFLNILQLTYWDQSVQTLSTQRGALRKQIWKNYLDRMLFSRGGKRHYSPQDSLHWLQWLAQQMSAHHQTLFMFKDLTANWLSEKSRIRHRWRVRILVGLICAFVIGLFIALGIARSFGVAIGLIYVLVVARLVVLDVFSLQGGGKRKSLSALLKARTWSQKEPRSEQVASLTFGLGLGLLSGFAVALGFGPIAGLIVGLVAGLRAYFYTRPFDMYPLPDSVLGQMHRPELRKELRLELAFGLAHTVVDGFIMFPFIDPIFDLYQQVNMCMLHFWLRWTRCLPWKTRRFLDVMHDRVILHRAGDGYQFLHGLLQEYLAQLEQGDPPPSVSSDLASPTSGRQTPGQ